MRFTASGTTRSNRATRSCKLYFIPGPYYQRPPDFCYEWTRSTVYLPTPDGRSDTLVVFDRTLASDPNRLASFAGAATTGIQRYRATGGNGQVADQQRIRDNPRTGTPALKQWIIHCPARPDLGDRSIDWRTAGGQEVRVQALLPADGVKFALDESTLWAPPLCQADQGGLGLRSPERKWQVRIRPAQAWPLDSAPVWDVFLNVIHAADPGAAADGTLVRARDGEAIGALIRRGGLANVLVLFSATPSTHERGRTEFRRVRTSGYVVEWDAPAERTDVLLFDLDPSMAWASTLGPGRRAALPVSPQGVGRIEITGTGRHVLAVDAK